MIREPSDAESGQKFRNLRGGPESVTGSKLNDGAPAIHEGAGI